MKRNFHFLTKTSNCSTDTKYNSYFRSSSEALINSEKLSLFIRSSIIAQPIKS